MKNQFYFHNLQINDTIIYSYLYYIYMFICIAFLFLTNPIIKP